MLNLSCKIHPRPSPAIGWIIIVLFIFCMHAFFSWTRRAVVTFSWKLVKPSICDAPRKQEMEMICLPEKHLLVIIPAAFRAWLCDPLTCLLVGALRWDRGPCHKLGVKKTAWSHCHVTHARAGNAWQAFRWQSTDLWHICAAEWIY